jgi:hypothetical protein
MVKKLLKMRYKSKSKKLKNKSKSKTRKHVGGGGNNDPDFKSLNQAYNTGNIKELVKEYRKLAAIYHPDKLGGKNVTGEKFKNLRIKYEKLKAILESKSVASPPSDNSSKQPKGITLDEDLKKELDAQFVLNEVQLYKGEGTAYFDIPNEYIYKFNNNTLANFIYEYMAGYGYNYATIHSSGHSLDPLDTLNEYAKPFKRTDDLNGFFIFCQKDYKFIQGEYNEQYNIAHFPKQEIMSERLTIRDKFNSIAIKDLH